jgi:hypothetical protein
MKRLVVVSSVLTMVVGAGIAGLTGAASAAPPCTNVSIPSMGGTFTAAEVNPGDVTTPVDANGCDIGVYYDNTGTGGTVSADVSNATHFGVFVDASGGNVNVNVTNSVIHNIGDNPGVSGNQQGIGIYYYALPAGSGSATGTVSGTTLSQYQKGGIVVKGATANVDVTDNTVTGLGPTPSIAQNGIQFSYGASGSVTGNAISDNWDNACSNQDAAQTGCTPWVSTGVLLYDINPGSIKVANNKFSGNQRNQYVIPSARF